MLRCYEDGWAMDARAHRALMGQDAVLGGLYQLPFISAIGGGAGPGRAREGDRERQTIVSR